MQILLLVNKVMKLLRSSCKKFSKKFNFKRVKKKKVLYETVKIKDLIFASTGVIGEKFPAEKITNRMNDLSIKIKR